ncbi:MAG TPA: hypothetical protein VKM54_20170 [Myxococcota bacterium]|nr:hypothetical protein [Myxococcota bacterium]
MPYVEIRDVSKGLLLIRFTGKLDDLAAFTLLRRLRDEGDWPNGFQRLLVDGRDASLEMTTRGVQQLAWRQNELFKFEPGSQMALVAGTPLAYEMSRLYQAHREHTRLAVGVFRSLREAHIWLGIQEGWLE